MHGYKWPINCTRMVHVQVLEARNLAPMDRNGKADPYIVLSCDGSRKSARTTTKLKTLNPSWATGAGDDDVLRQARFAFPVPKDHLKRYEGRYDATSGTSSEGARTDYPTCVCKSQSCMFGRWWS